MANNKNVAQPNNNTSKQIRNLLHVDFENRTVTKEYISGTLEERKTRLMQEAQALIEIPQYTKVIRTPRLISTQENPNPILVMEYIDYKETLSKNISRKSLRECFDILASSFSAIQDLHSSTSLGIRNPDDVMFRIQKYGTRHANAVGIDIINQLLGLASKMPPGPWSMTHQDFKASNILVKPGSSNALIDWEHYGQGTTIYDIATMFTNLSIMLATQNKLDDLLVCLDVFPSTVDFGETFYLCVATRVLVEYGPAMVRLEYGPSDHVVLILRHLLKTAIAQVQRGETLRQFIKRVQLSS